MATPGANKLNLMATPTANKLNFMATPGANKLNFNPLETNKLNLSFFRS